jgi:hypothetical protein
MIYRLKYNDRAEAESDLLERQILQEVEGSLVRAERTHSVVWVGKIVDVEANYDDEGNELTAATFIEGYHVDVMLKDTEDFGAYEVHPDTPNHKWAD